MSRRTKKAESRRNGPLHPRYNYAKMRSANVQQMYYHMLYEMAVNRFEWTGLPSTVSARWLEITLFDNGLALFFNDQRIGRFLCTQASQSRGVNLYNDPIAFTPIGVNYTYRTLKRDSECVPIWENRLRYPMRDVLIEYSVRLAEIDKAYNVNLSNLKIPLLVTADEKTRLSVQNALQQREDGQPAIIGYDGMDPSAMFQSFPQVGPYLLDQLTLEKSKVLNECLSFLGVQSSGSEKRERLISDEISTANEKTDIWRTAALRARQEACDKINRTWPELNIGVKWGDPQTGGVPNLNVRQEGDVQ